jgi:hypothetical protein
MKTFISSRFFGIFVLFALFAAFLIPAIALADQFGPSGGGSNSSSFGAAAPMCPHPVPETGLSVLLAAGFVGLGIVLYVKRRKSGKKANLS